MESEGLRDEAVEVWRAQLVEDVWGVMNLKRHEENGMVGEMEYRAATWMRLFWAQFGCRVRPFPEDVVFSLKPEIDGTVLHAM